jgi:hypothetical protein
MANDPVDILLPAAHEPPPAPLAGSRSQSIQRLQVGLFGLAAMVLLVALANIIRNNAEQNEATVVPEAAPIVADGKEPAAVSDPLADAGVVPDVATDEPADGNAPPPQP